MKKLLGIVFIGLLLCSSAFAEKKKYSLFGVVLGDDINKYNPQTGYVKDQLIIDVPNPNKNFILYYAVINKKTNKIVIIGGVHKKNYPLADQDKEREELVQNMLDVARKCKVENQSLIELITEGSQFKEFNNTIEDFKSNISQTQVYFYDGDKQISGEGGNIKFSIRINCINKEGTIVEGEKIGARAKITLIDFRNIYQDSRDNKEFDKQQLDKSGLQ